MEGNPAIISLSGVAARGACRRACRALFPAKIQPVREERKTPAIFPRKLTYLAIIRHAWPAKHPGSFLGILAPRKNVNRPWDREQASALRSPEHLPPLIRLRKNLLSAH